MYDLEGTLPPDYDVLRGQLEAEQANDPLTDYMTEAPLLLTRAITGLRIDEIDDQESRRFMELERQQGQGRSGTPIRATNAPWWMFWRRRRS